MGEDSYFSCKNSAAICYLPTGILKEFLIKTRLLTNMNFLVGKNSWPWNSGQKSIWLRLI